jgi:exonuclease VII small subunit
MDKEAMKKAIINSLNGKLKDGIKASDIADNILDKEDDGIIKAKPKISYENARKIVEEIVTQFELGDMGTKEAGMLLNKIMFGKLTLENGDLKYTLKSPIQRGDGNEKTFPLFEPSQKSFDDNNIDLVSIMTAMENGNLSALPKDLMSTCACIFLGIQSDLGKQLGVSDVMNLFSIGCQLFLAG